MVKNNDILIVEDDIALITALNNKFSESGFTVYKAYDGEEGLNIAYEKHPDILLLDILIPKLDGITLLSKLREDEWGSKVPVVIMSNLSFSEYEINACNKYKVKKYLTKADWDINKIEEEVEKYILKA
ncbi:hypothetical protein A3F07_02030 [candidate division WWE3 bacterium RIFCSPHIGHO2_12_FULL_38_15]|uniref:Response regulatory domain-containing protein n=1 Tax=candidate division WWE3 bacterium RIFCSPHIGHO2_02_FULL_38_14 TaxID=1802620 RepID=A0A1F4V8J4_UNCKA|nr:MAG: hypothetical protein A2793_03265 [candidate division WWE3 bacterium RIFCSPHIGHO2_01_FULL_38_45]OGC48659.1 MAG: hypothetical protein A3F07_02030 [candidate division WWE3 bacterium RIFCSPHIGHO2_12_FULL_38_15]OGC53065.1 MAG: hypothetical protein A3B64_01290 [candidate division WWE3 bacterium RIFCSPLOWO2_01_FULL_37_24]OGC53428.1 MAG: hypothetical protein A3D91_00145 [candidate division WWE3 bacterium RIFCSPHIGHO2_02_FULL_38_14]HLB51902.1 response regulator [Patescibacteria group bacterium]